MVPIADACVVDRFSVLAWVSLPDTELAIVISRPSRIQAVPSPSTSRVWNGDHLSRSSRAGMVLRTGCCCCCCLAATVVMTDFLFSPGLGRAGRRTQGERRLGQGGDYGSGTIPCAPRGNFARVSSGMFRCAETSL